jgi:hypothetical protein
MNEYYFNKIMTDDEISHLEGHFFTESDFKIHIKQDCDGFTLDSFGNKKLLFKFRKNVIPNYLCDLAILHLEAPAKKKNYNRGASAGLLEKSKMPKNISDIIQTEKFRARVKFQNDFSKFQIGNMSQSNIVGFYDDTKSKNNFPCRMTQFTRDHPEIWLKCLPLIQYVDSLFKETLFDKWENQMNACNKTNFRIENTCFSTITLNYNFQTALHKDKGDFKNGFGNLTVFRRGNWKGNYLGLYQYGVLIYIDHGDYLTFDVHEWHCNSELIIMDQYNDMRLSMVYYLRETIIKRCNNIYPLNFDKETVFYKRIYYDKINEIEQLKYYSKAYNYIKDDSFLNSKIIYSEISKENNRYIGPLQYMLLINFFVNLLDKDYIHNCKFLRIENNTGRFKTLNSNYCLIEIFNLCKIYKYNIKLVILSKKKELIQIVLS